MMMNILIVFQAATLEAGHVRWIGCEVGLNFRLLNGGGYEQLTIANAG